LIEFPELSPSSVVPLLKLVATAREPRKPAHFEGEFFSDFDPSDRSTWPTVSSFPPGEDAGEVVRVLRRHKDEILACRKREPAGQENAHGQMTVRLMIHRSGTVSDVSVSPHRFEGSVLGECVTASVRTWRFSTFSGPPLPLDFPVIVR
jgi:hypothetical protein